MLQETPVSRKRDGQFQQRDVNFGPREPIPLRFRPVNNNVLQAYRECDNLMTRKATLSLHFPYGSSLKPIQARDVAIVTRCGRPVSSAW